uniref:Uncharacterized protein n=1 Tax=Heliothis virescens TaxID=7102 RepID=A0A2A4JJH9_HELVI
MRVELPVLARCCICLPLRYGLIVWGYIRLCISLFLLTGVTTGFAELLNRERRPDEDRTLYLGIVGTVIVLTFNDIVLNILFIIGGHKKNLKFLRAYYIYSIILWILMILLYILFTAQSFSWLQSLSGEENGMMYVWMVVLDFIVYVGHIAMQFYFILLIRSEVVKLTTNCEFRFVNHAAQLEMKYDIDGAKVTCGSGNTNVEDTCKMSHENDPEQ